LPFDLRTVLSPKNLTHRRQVSYRQSLVLQQSDKSELGLEYMLQQRFGVFFIIISKVCTG